MKTNQILIVDDKEENLYLLRSLLQGHGHEVVTAVNGVEALKNARQNLPRLIISDILMPVMDGYALCREWRMDEKLKAVPFIFYTATYTDERDQEFALSLGADKFIVKPVEPESLMASIREVLELKGNQPAPITREEAGASNAPGLETPGESETGFLKQYNGVLIRKLELKMMQLKQANLELEQDIVMRKRAEDELRESEERFRLLAEYASDIVFRISMIPQPKVEYVSPSVQRTFGYTPEELYSDFSIMMKIIAGAHHQWFLDSLANPEDRLEGVVIECRHRDGSQRWIELNSTAVRDEQGRVMATHNIARDATMRIIKEKELEESEEKFRNFVEYSGDAIYVLQDERFVFVNPRFEKLFQTSAAEVRDESFNFREYISDDSLSLIMERGASRQRGESLSPSYEFRGRRKDGCSLDLEATVSDFTYQGKPAVLGFIRDISERKLAEKTLEESEARFRSLFDVAPEGIFVQSEGDFVFVNPAMLRLVGADKEEDILGKDLFALIAPEYREMVSKRVQTQSESGKVATPMEMAFLRLDGTQVPVETIAVPLKYQGHDAHLVFVRDINERKQAEKTLAESENRFRSLIEGAPEGIFVHRDGRFVFLNPAMLRLFGAEKVEDMVGTEISSILAPEYQEAVSKRIQTRTKIGVITPPMELEFLRHDGTRIPLETTGALIQFQGQVAHLVFVRDISERKQAEKSKAWMLQSLESSPLAAIQVDPDGNTKWINQQFKTVLGFSSEDVVDKPVTSFFDFSAPGLEDSKRLISILNGKVGRWYGTISTFARDGTEISFYLAVASVTDSEGGSLGAIVKLIDRRELETLEKTNVGLENELSQQFHLSQVGLLTSGISHNLRNPLSVIIMRISQLQQDVEAVLKKSPEDPIALYDALDKSLLILQKIFLAADRINLMIDELMDYHTMNMQSDDGATDLNHVIQADAGLLKADMNIKHKIELGLDLLPGHLWVEMRPSEISQIFLNLTANARDAMIDESVTQRMMTIRSGVSDDGSEVWFEVQDTGIGMPQEIREKMGQPFISTKRDDPKSRQCGSGTGLGLYMIKRLLDDHGGHLELDSKPGDTRFRIHLQAVEQPVQVAQ